MLLKGRYEVLETLSSTARLARERSSGRKLVVKELVVKELGSWDDLSQLEDEARTLASVDHPAVPALVDTFFLDEESPDPRFFLVREYVDGVPLAAHLEVRLSQDGVRALAAQLLQILDQLHRLSPPLIHGDLSPEKVFRRADGALVLIGFGRAPRPLGPRAGEDGFLAPERAHSPATVASDLYSVGAILFALSTGRSPALLAHEGGVPRLDEPIEPDIRRLVEQVLRIDPAERPRSAVEALELLGRGGALARLGPTALGASRVQLRPTVAVGALGALLELVLLVASPTAALLLLPPLLGALYLSYRAEQRTVEGDDGASTDGRSGP